MRMAWFAAMISASTVLWEVAVCFFDCALSGKKECGPYKARKTPDVLLCGTLSPAKSASENNPSESSDGVVTDKTDLAPLRSSVNVLDYTEQLAIT